MVDEDGLDQSMDPRGASASEASPFERLGRPSMTSFAAVGR